MSEHKYFCEGTCSRGIEFEIDEDGKLRNVEFIGGCNGNANGICRLVEGQDAKSIAQTLKGTTCGFKETSCPDQLSRAIEEAIR
ncbi:MAG: TIGR03905 family TSCPD domain-containing protein [Coriobacteriales bacterium]|nr:TIGR03905 family TSCPD domain-containing protein [Coriobacteriales bacterium]